jgi:hypothetical protein
MTYPLWLLAKKKMKFCVTVLLTNENYA